MKNIRSFENLDVWELAKNLAVDIYKVSNKGALNRDFGLKDQIRRAAVSIPSNIAEGKEKGSIKELVRFLYIAKGSAGELKTQLSIANEIGYLDTDPYEILREQVSKISAMLGALINALKKRNNPH